MLTACRARFWEHDQQAWADRRLQPNVGEKCGLAEVRPHGLWKPRRPQHLDARSANDLHAPRLEPNDFTNRHAISYPPPIATLKAWCFFVLLTFVALPQDALARAELEIEFVPGLAIPLTDFLSTDGPTFSEVTDSGVGFAGEIHVLLDDWEFGYSASVLPTNSVTTDVNEEFSALYNEASVSAAEALGQDLLGTLDAGTTRRSGSDVAAVTIHHIHVGYRFYPFRDRIRIYIPIGVGLALVTSDKSMLSRTLYGFGANTGVGLDYDFLPWLRVGGAIRYRFTFSESAGDITLRSVIANFGFSEDLITTTFHTGHVLHIALTAQITF